MRPWIKDMLGIVAAISLGVAVTFFSVLMWAWSRTAQDASDAFQAVQAQADAVAPVISGLNATVDGLNGTIAALNAPCVGFHGSVTCGPIAQLSQTEKNIGIVAGQTALQVRQSGQLVDAATASLRDVSAKASVTFDTMNAQLTHVGPVLDSAKGTLDASTTAINGVDARVKDKRLDEMLTHWQGMSESGDKMLTDAQWKTHQLLHPDKVKLGLWGSLWAGMKALHAIEPPIF